MPTPAMDGNGDPMAYRTTMELTSGDRAVLDATVATLRSIAESKGAQVAGPHTKPSRTVRVPLYKRVGGDATFGTWEYDVYVRELMVTGYDSVAEALASERLPPSVAVAMTIDHIEPVGANR